MWTTLDLAVNIYCHLHWAHALIRCYLRTGRKYALIKKHALNKHVRLLTRPRPDFTVYVYWLNLVYMQTQKMVSYIVALCIVVIL